MVGRIASCAATMLTGAVLLLSVPSLVQAQAVDGSVVTLADADSTRVDIANQISQIEAASGSEAAFKALVGEAALQGAELVAAVVAWSAAGSPERAAELVAWALEAVVGTPAEGASALIAASTGGLPGIDATAVNVAVQNADVSAATKTQVAGTLAATGGGFGDGSGFGAAAVGTGGFGLGGIPGTGGGAS